MRESALGGSEAAVLRSVNERETPSLLKGGGDRLKGLVEDADLGERAGGADSNERRPVGGPPLSGDAELSGFSSSKGARFRRAGHMYSMMRVPTLASICSRMGWKLSSNDS